MDWNQWEGAPCIDKWALFDSAAEDEAANRVQFELWPQGKELCKRCPHLAACLDSALAAEAAAIGRGAHSRYHLRGGMGPAERQREHERRGMVYLCARCRTNPRKDKGHYCAPCLSAGHDQAKAAYDREKRAKARLCLAS